LDQKETSREKTNTECRVKSQAQMTSSIGGMETLGLSGFGHYTVIGH
jgi:hypothetical protein